MLHNPSFFRFRNKRDPVKDNEKYYDEWKKSRQKNSEKVFKGITLDEIENEGFISKTDKEGIIRLCTKKGAHTIIVGESSSGKSLIARAIANEIPGTYIEVPTTEAMINPYRNKPTRNAVVVVDTLTEDNMPPSIGDAKNALVVVGGHLNEALSLTEKNYGIRTAQIFSAVVEIAICEKDGMPYIKYYGLIY